MLPARFQFLLEVGELAGLTARLEPWRRDVFTPLVIEVGNTQASAARTERSDKCLTAAATAAVLCSMCVARRLVSHMCSM
jgi:hypothetical protein